MDKKGRAPMFGGDCSDSYVTNYLRSHEDTMSQSYRFDYAENLLVDALFEEYTLLYVGCGTGGFLRLHPRAKLVHGIDYSPKMIEACNTLIERFAMNNVEATLADFASFSPDRQYDIVQTAGVHGSYLPHTEEALQKVHALLKPGGFGLFSLTAPPRTASHCWKRCKAWLRRKPLIEIHPDRFRRMLARTGFVVRLELKKGERPDRFFLLCQKG
ncbi:MAG: methyltransferase domain-containing protein [Magnetococcales bacterium]|nr:methyltransferase domain-containing protein [Magnetococcales bacterium]